jgi:hypothetical protein
LFAALLLASLAWPALGQAPAVEQSPDKVVVSNPCYRVALLRTRGGTISEVALPDGTPVLGGDLLYTDHGLYPEGNTVGSDKETNATVQVRREGNRVIVASRGTLRGEGALREPERRLEYTFTYTFDASPTIHVRYAATPSFALAQPTGFFSYLMGVPRFAEWFAKTAEGLIFQPAGPANGRCFQSAEDPLDLDEPWVGVLLPEGTLIAWSHFGGTPAPSNVFLHESGKGSAGFFCAWVSGAAPADLAAGQPWTADFDLHIWPKAMQSTVALPAFIG